MPSIGKPAALELLEKATGLTFVYVPAGTARVGITSERFKFVIDKSSFSDYYSSKYFPETQVSLPDFWIATDLFRLSHWQQLQQSCFALALQKAISPQEIDNYKYNWVSDVKWGIDFGFKVFAKDKFEADPALKLTLEKSTIIAKILGMKLPNWAQWEVATRGREGYLFPWGNSFDLSQVQLSYLRYSYTWEDPESTMGLGRDTEYISGSYCRIEGFGQYASTVSPFGLKGLMYWGAEWNTVDAADPNLEKIGEKYTHILRSLLDCGCSRSTANLSDRESENQMLRASDHRAFSGVPLAGFTTADFIGKLGAFRLVYNPENGAL